MAESRFIELVLRTRAFIALGVVTLVFSLLSPEFLTTANLSILVKHVAINAILAIGMTFVILSGGIDLSVGSIVGFSGMVAGFLLSRGLVLESLGIVVYPHAWFVVTLALLAGMAIGAIVLIAVWWTAAVGWTWYALLGASVTAVSALAASLVLPRTRPAR